jgi:tRNA threonylcarbamoyladenosine biosynthesis protein TsaE
MEKIVIKNEQETAAFGRVLSERLVPGSVVALSGDLGVGKTTLTKAIAAGLGIRSQITSPTFLLLQEYKEGRMPLYHFDVYRLSGSEDMYELGFEDYLFGDGVCVIEWADQIEDLLPPETIRIHIDYGTDEDERIYTVTEGAEAPQ